MTVQQYTKKPDTVEAIQFVGGAPNGPEIVSWVQGLDGTAIWFDEIPAVAPEEDGEGNVTVEGVPGRPEFLRLGTLEGLVDLPVGSWVVRGNLSGRFYGLSDDEFHATFA